MAAAQGDTDAGFRVSNFLVKIDGITVSNFSEVAMPDGRIDVIEYREGGEPASSARKLAGRAHYDNLILRRGVDQNVELYEWWNLARQGMVTRRSVSIVLLDITGSALRRWNFSQAFPVRYRYADLNALGTDVLIETLELAYEDVSLE